MADPTHDSDREAPDDAAPTEPDEPAAEQPPAARQRPEYGEYAPEGWQSPVTSPQTTSEPSAASTQTTPAPAASYPLTGVPHNLGVSGGGTGPSPSQAPQSPAQAPPVTQQGAQHGTQQEQQQTQQQQTQQQQSQPPTQQHRSDPAQTPASGGRIADRIVTIVLLAIGAFAALNISTSLMTLSSGLALIAEFSGDGALQIPDSVSVVSTVGTLLILTLFAVMLIWSIQRLRRGKLTFWVPLSAGVLSIILWFVIITIAVLQMPELMQSITPEDMDRLLQSVIENPPS